MGFTVSMMGSSTPMVKLISCTVRRISADIRTSQGYVAQHHCRCSVNSSFRSRLNVLVRIICCWAFILLSKRYPDACQREENYPDNRKNHAFFYHSRRSFLVIAISMRSFSFDHSDLLRVQLFHDGFAGDFSFVEVRFPGNNYVAGSLWC